MKGENFTLCCNLFQQLIKLKFDGIFHFVARSERFLWQLNLFGRHEKLTPPARGLGMGMGV